MKKLIYLLLFATVFCVRVSAQSSQEDSPENLQKYVPLLPSVKAQVWKIDPKLGYAVHSGGEAYTSSPITDGNLHSL